MVMTVLKIELQQNDLLFSLNLNYPKDFAKMLEWVENDALAEEAWDRWRENLSWGLQCWVGEKGPSVSVASTHRVKASSFSNSMLEQLA